MALFKKQSALLALFIIVSFLFIHQTNATEPDTKGNQQNYTWASDRLNGEFWGMAIGKIDSSGSEKILLLERNKIQVGMLNDKTFKKNFECGFEGNAKGMTIGLIDLDGDGDEEAVVSAVEDGMPASMGFDFKNDSCKMLFSRSRWSLRVIEENDGARKLVGQSWASDAFFFGLVYHLSLKDGKLKKSDKLDLPRGVGLFQFAILPPNEASERVAILKGFQTMEIKEKNGRSFKRIWRTGERFDGSTNLISARQRNTLGEVESEMASFDLPPIVSTDKSDFMLIARRHDLPLKGVIGKRPWVSGAEIVGFSIDPVLGFREVYRTLKLPGPVVDYAIDNSGKNGAKRLFVLMQYGANMFLESEKSVILVFEGI